MADAQRALYANVGEEHFNLSDIFRHHPEKAVQFAISTFGIPQFCKDNWDDSKKQSQGRAGAQPEVTGANTETSSPADRASAVQLPDNIHPSCDKPRRRKRRRPRAKKSGKKRARVDDDKPSEHQKGQEFAAASGPMPEQTSSGVKRAHSGSDRSFYPRKRQKTLTQKVGTTGVSAELSTSTHSTAKRAHPDDDELSRPQRRQKNRRSGKDAIA
ncbi:hypothetical protein TrVFT333_009510 [Trichoderma virens FT-333]|nr:hypothetical protein TrVFT333_009510 [Trichoderma virens FT-333]